MSVEIVREPEGVRSAVRAWRRQGLTVGFVPTMGALHLGHTGLVEAARAAGADRVVVSIFVNPTQFGPSEDLAAYPRDLQGDVAKLAAVGTDLVFTPSTATIYPPRSETRVSLSELPNHLCGLSRPVHFGGVATVVTLLFNIVQPDLAVFGQKDFQQLRVIERLTQDLHFPIRIIGAPIAREESGLARSSRNAYLTPDERARASCIYAALSAARGAVLHGEQDAGRLIEQMSATCVAAGGRVDYAAIVNEDTLEAVHQVTGTARALLAVYFGRARLIDNVRLERNDTGAPSFESAPDDVGVDA